MDYTAAFEIMQTGRLVRRRAWKGYRSAGLSEPGAKTSASNANICGLNEMGVMSKIRISEEDLSAEDWEAVLFSFLPEPENRRDQEKDIESPKNEGAV